MKNIIKFNIIHVSLDHIPWANKLIYYFQLVSLICVDHKCLQVLEIQSPLSLHWDHLDEYWGWGGLWIKGGVHVPTVIVGPNHFPATLLAGEHIIVVEVLGVVAGCAV